MASLDDSLQYVGTTTNEDVPPLPLVAPPPVTTAAQRSFDVPLPIRTIPVPTSLDIPPRPSTSTSATPRLPLPTMSEANIDGYFLSLEFWFQASNVIDDNQKYVIVMSQIPPHKLIDLRTVIDNAPPISKYHYIKEKLLSQYTDSQQRRLKRVLSEMPLGDQKPSALFNTMSRVAEGSLTESALVDLWASRLPESIHTAVAASDGTVPSKLKLADAIFNSLDLRAHANINEVQVPQPTEQQQPTSQPISCHPEVLGLVQMIGALLREPQQRSRSTGKQSAKRQLNFSQKMPQPTNNRGQRNTQRYSAPVEEEDWDLPTEPIQRPVKILSERRRDSSVERFKDCWYHRTFGQAATTCRPPCTHQA